MAKLLYIESSPRKHFSKSIEVANVFLNEYKKTHPNDVIETIDLWNYALPRFDDKHADAKYSLFDEQPLNPEEKRSWKDVERVINQFKSGDKYLFSVPMWVFTVPYVLKHFMDVVTQPTFTFTYSRKEGFVGLLNGKVATVIYSRGGVYGHAGGEGEIPDYYMKSRHYLRVWAYGRGIGGTPTDLQTLQMEAFLNLMGITNINSIFIEPTLGKVEKVVMAVARAKEEAKKIAHSF